MTGLILASVIIHYLSQETTDYVFALLSYSVWDATEALIIAWVGTYTYNNGAAAYDFTVDQINVREATTDTTMALHPMLMPHGIIMIETMT